MNSTPSTILFIIAFICCIIAVGYGVHKLIDELVDLNIEKSYVDERLIARYHSYSHDITTVAMMAYSRPDIREGGLYSTSEIDHIIQLSPPFNRLTHSFVTELREMAHNIHIAYSNKNLSAIDGIVMRYQEMILDLIEQEETELDANTNDKCTKK